ncbi:alpha/beta hydrolase [Pedobacter sp. BS3]|uniref:alpha/beta hydrolase n=1 Tax=Pedobacter sp. BS3 TaxID=2567937 RepID=UPI0011ED85B1|nr:alpha/beta hydrolase [Pedobacter sp. BS3]TZF84938.1 alpha/beta hydrolase [Pedobacter sp. BS3]
MKLNLIIALCMISLGSSAQKVIPLYQTVPNAIAGPNEEKTDIDKNKAIRISDVSIPTLTAYLPNKAKANGTAVVICPGGGYARLAVGHEGYDVAEAFNKLGVAAFVLKYRLPSDKIMQNKEIGPLQDAQQAIKLVRMHAKEWNIDTGKVGIMGFSAGGHLASTAGTHFNMPVIGNKENTNLRPDFMILMYPVISFADTLMHKGSRDRLLGTNPTPEKIKLYSNELQITAQTPPTFMVHAEDDKTVKVFNSLYFYENLVKNHVPAEIHIYPKGGHGFGLNNTTTPDKWFDHCKNWMIANGWIKG